MRMSVSGRPRMGDERVLAVSMMRTARRPARQQRGDQLDVEALGAAAEAAADERLHRGSRHVHVEDLGQHQVHVVGHLGGGVHGEAVAHGVVLGERRVHLHLVLADLGAVVGGLAHEIGLGEAAATSPSSKATSRSRLPGFLSWMSTASGAIAALP
jgi:hypothetical protein